MEQTKEGEASYDAGDYKMTGVEGEIWPMKAEVFNKNYEIIGDNTATKKKVLVDVTFAKEDTKVTTAWGASLTAKKDDAIVSASAEDRWVVSRSIFDSTYLPEDN